MCYRFNRNKNRGCHILIRAVVFDCDGPILDSFRAGLKRIKILCAIHEIPFGRKERLRLTELWGLPGIELLEQGLGISRALAEAMYPQWEHMDLHDPIPLVPGAREALYWLRKNGIVSTLLTSRHREKTHEILDRLDLEREFTVTATKEDTQFHKPDPRAFWFTLEKLKEKGIQKKNCVFVGDTPADIEAGKRAEIKTIVVQTGPYLLKHVTRYPIPLQNIINSVDDLPLWIEEHHEGKLLFSYD